MGRTSRSGVSRAAAGFNAKSNRITKARFNSIRNYNPISTIPNQNQATSIAIKDARRSGSLKQIVAHHPGGRGRN